MPNPYIDTSFESLYKENPLILADIGAKGGINKRWACFKEHLRVVGFEPDKRAFEKLPETKKDGVIFKYLNTGLYNAQSEIKFYATKKEGNSSILLPNKDLLSRFPDQERYDVVNTETIKVDLLDNQLKENCITDVDFIKIDTQGSELFILQGATDILQNSVFGLEIEVEFLKVYEGQPLFADVDNFLRHLGFQLFDLRKAHWKRIEGKGIKGGKGQVVFGDALYFKQEGALFRHLDVNHQREAKAKILKALSICVVFGYLDYALTLSREALDRGIVNRQEAEIIKKHIILSNKGMRVLPDFKGKWRIANLLYKLHKLFKQDSWTVSDVDLGNID